MLKTFLLFTLGCLTFSKGIAQYIHYEPNPTVVAAPVIIPQPIQLMPPTRFLPPTDNEVKPTIRILYKFLILSAKVNGNDVSQHYKNANAGVAIYSLSNQDATFMTVVLPGDNANSNGKMIAVTEKEVPQTATQPGKTITTFAWDFVNSYDGRDGTASVTISKEYHTDGTYVKCNIQASNGIICDLDGIIPL